MAGLSHSVRRWQRRAASIVLAMAAVGGLALLFRTLSAAGTFSDAAAGFDGSCRLAARLPVTALAADEDSGLVFLAAAGARGQTSAGALYVLDLTHPELPPQRLSGTPSPFRPYAVALERSSGGALTLFAGNRRTEKSGSVDIFTVTRDAAGVHLGEAASIGSTLFAHIAALAPGHAGQFYAADSPEVATDFASLLAGYLRPYPARIIYYGGQFPRVVETGLRGVRGLALSADGSRLYAGLETARAIRSYAVQPVSGRLDRVDDYALPAAPAQLSPGADGALWAAGDPKLFARARFEADPARKSPSLAMRVGLSGGVPQSALRLFGDPGGLIAAADAIAFSRGHLLLGSALDEKLLDCTLR